MKSGPTRVKRRTWFTQAAMACGLFAMAAEPRLEVQSEWNQWLGGPGRTLTLALRPAEDSVPVFKEQWRRSLGSGFAGLSVFGTNAVTAMSDGKQDVALLLDPATGAERWRFPIGRTKKRSEGAPLGPLATPALDAEFVYVQSLDGRFVCLETTTGHVRWEISLKGVLKAYEPGYGFASSPLLLDGLVVLLPAGSSANSVAALDRRTGARRWGTSAGAGAEYASATAWSAGGKTQIVAHLRDRLVGVSAENGRLLWTIDNVTGGLWTPSVLRDGSVFCPTATETRLLAPHGDSARVVWTSPVFEGVMGAVVELGGMLIGHHKRRLTGVEAATGHQLWQQSSETDGQLLVWGRWLVFVNDRAGKLIVFAASRTGLEIKSEQPVFQPTRMETPLATAPGKLFIRTPTELVALRAEPPPITAPQDLISP